MKIADIVLLYRDIGHANYVRVREPYGENGCLGTLSSVKRLMDTPLAEAHVSSIFVATNSTGGGVHIEVVRTGSDYFSVGECIRITQNIKPDDMIVFIDEDAEEVLYVRAYDILNDNCEMLEYEVIEVWLGSEHHVIYIQSRS